MCYVTCYKFHILVISQYFLHSIGRPERRHFSIKKEEIYRTSLEKSIATLSVINSYVCIQLCYQLMSKINASLWEHQLSQCINDLMHHYTPLSIADQIIYPNLSNIMNGLVFCGFVLYTQPICVKEAWPSNLNTKFCDWFEWSSCHHWICFPFFTEFNSQCSYENKFLIQK